MELDALDQAIIRALLADGRASYRTLATRVESTTPTVSARVTRLHDLGVITGYAAKVTPSALPGMFVVRVHVEEEATHAVAQAVGDIEGAELVNILDDGTILARVASDAPRLALEARVKEIGGVRDAEVREIVTATENARDREIKNIALRCPACRGPIHGEGIHRTIKGHHHVYCCEMCAREHAEKYERLARSA